MHVHTLCFVASAPPSLPPATIEQCNAPRPSSPLLTQPQERQPGPSYILHPPLPVVTTSVSGVTPSVAGSISTGLPGVHIPLLLNPDILQSTPIPYISPQVLTS